MQIIRKSLPAESLPGLQDYMEAVTARQKASAAAKGVTEICGTAESSRMGHAITSNSKSCGFRKNALLGWTSWYVEGIGVGEVWRTDMAMYIDH